MVNKGHKLTEEHKRKISKALKGRFKGIHRSPKSEFKKGCKTWNKGKPHLKIREENHYKWKGGSRSTAKQILIRNKVDLTTCKICKEKIRTLIHHIDGNMRNNKLNNLAVVCYFCHNAMHGTGIKTRFQVGHKVPIEWKIKRKNANKKPMEVIQI